MAFRTAPPRTPLNRDRIVAAALAYIDDHGLAALSMHKLGAALGVKAMSLYNHVANKDDVLDGVVEQLWAEVEETAQAAPNWQDGVRSFAEAIRAMILRHPGAATLQTSQSYMPQSALRAVKNHVEALVDHGIPQPDAYDLLRTVTSYTLGTAYNEVAWAGGEQTCPPDVAAVLRPGTPDDLAQVAQVFCGRYDYETHFRLGLDLMLAGAAQRIDRD